MVDRSRASLGIERIKTILGYQRRSTFHRKDSAARRWQVVVEKPTYALTVFKVACGRLTLKAYTKGEHVLRLEALVPNTEEPDSGRELSAFPISWYVCGKRWNGSWRSWPGSPAAYRRRNLAGTGALGLGGQEPCRGNRFEPAREAGGGRSRYRIWPLGREDLPLRSWRRGFNPVGKRSTDFAVSPTT